MKFSKNFDTETPHGVHIFEFRRLKFSSEVTYPPPNPKQSDVGEIWPGGVAVSTLEKSI